MATYVIGDVQGCFEALENLLTKLAFDKRKDQLWFAGDLVNRGPDSLSCLRTIKNLGNAARVVLGNHDLHLLATYYGKRLPKRKDTFKSVLEAPDCESLMFWLRHQPLMILDQEKNFSVTHAGLPHIWSTAYAFALSQEVEAILQSEQCVDFFAEMYGNEPENWSDQLTGMTRLRVITNYFTRMRFISSEGALNLLAKEGSKLAPPGFLPWFDIPRSDKTRIMFGHWAALEGVTGHTQFQALDTGCVWGGSLTAVDVETLHRVSYKV